MKRVLVVDDEQHVVDHIVRILEREVPEEFPVVGSAASGRETLELVPRLQPDIVVLDVRMPGLSGLDTVRELQKRGSPVAFVLSTAYERFDIAREALELGITGYLLKPVGRDELLQSLRTAAVQLDRRAEAHDQEFARAERHRDVEAFAASAFLTGLMVGLEITEAARSRLGLTREWGLVAAAAFLHNPAEGRADLEAVLQYKTEALCGPLVSDRCLIFLPLATEAEAPAARRALVDALGPRLGPDLDRGRLRLGVSDPRPLTRLAPAWPEALARLQTRPTEPSTGPRRFASGGAFAEEEAFHTALVQGDADRVRFAFEALLAPFEAAASVSVADRYRIISFLGTALGHLVGLGGLDEASAHQGMDFDDLRQAPDGPEFCLLARSRLPSITGALHRSRRWSAPLALALDHIRDRFGEALTLDGVAEVVGLTPKRLSKSFIDELGQGFSDYLIDFRIEKARVLLALPGASIKLVSRECGYPDPNYFARLFKKVTGSTPSEYSASVGIRLPAGPTDGIIIP